MSQPTKYNYFSFLPFEFYYKNKTGKNKTEITIGNCSSNNNNDPKKHPG